jgi:hypothetical protein
MLEQPQLVGLLPLMPLTKNGQNRETLERLIQKMEQAGTWNKDTLLGQNSREPSVGKCSGRRSPKRVRMSNFHSMV